MCHFSSFTASEFRFLSNFALFECGNLPNQQHSQPLKWQKWPFLELLNPPKLISRKMWVVRNPGMLPKLPSIWNSQNFGKRVNRFHIKLIFSTISHNISLFHFSHKPMVRTSSQRRHSTRMRSIWIRCGWHSHPGFWWNGRIWQIFQWTIWITSKWKIWNIIFSRRNEPPYESLLLSELFILTLSGSRLC